MKLFINVIIICIVIIIISPPMCNIASAEEDTEEDTEEITLTTYYPAPYGEYENLQANKLSVGVDLPANDGDVAIGGNLTIGAYTLPNTAGTDGQVLKADASGVVSWEPSQSGTIGTPIHPEHQELHIVILQLVLWFLLFMLIKKDLLAIMDQ